MSGASKGIPRVLELLSVSKTPKRIFYRLKSANVNYINAMTIKNLAKSVQTLEWRIALGVPRSIDCMMEASR